MWNKLLIVLLAATACPFSSQVKAQTGNSQDEKAAKAKQQDGWIGFSFVPQHLFKKGFRLDFEYKFKQSKSALVLAPLYYGGNIDNDASGTSNDELLGYGAELIHKIYLGDSEEGTSSHFYLGHGPYFRHFEVDFKVEGWLKRQEGDVTVYEKGLTDHTRTINKYGYNFMLGITLMQEDGFMVDFYFGGGIRAASTSTTQNNPDKPGRSFENSIIDYGYNGPVPLVGLKFGAHF